MSRERACRRYASYWLLPVPAPTEAVRPVPPAGMTDYCQVPPYVIQNIPPNVLILLDISRSMLYFSYYDGYQTPDHVGRQPVRQPGCSLHGVQLVGASRIPQVLRLLRPRTSSTSTRNVFTPRRPEDGSASGQRMERRLPELVVDAPDRRHAEGPDGRATQREQDRRRNCRAIPSRASSGVSPRPKRPRTPLHYYRDRMSFSSSLRGTRAPRSSTYATQNTDTRQ